ncbi:MAG: hypothetical protein GY700_07490, partial [Propionibacteriaceae bacterium]|nr:hypothetical protein [Propionibacteriaceae bacterium]
MRPTSPTQDLICGAVVGMEPEGRARPGLQIFSPGDAESAWEIEEEYADPSCACPSSAAAAVEAVGGSPAIAAAPEAPATAQLPHADGVSGTRLPAAADWDVALWGEEYLSLEAGELRFVHSGRTECWA